jgi:hypothetical protein
MQLCFVFIHGPRDTYFVDEPRIYELPGLNLGLGTGYTESFPVFLSRSNN